MGGQMAMTLPFKFPIAQGFTIKNTRSLAVIEDIYHFCI